MVAAAVAAGAFVAAGHAASSTPDPSSDAVTPLAAGDQAAAQVGVGGPVAAPEFVPMVRGGDIDAVQALARSEQVLAERAARLAEARRPLFVVPAEGSLTSGFGARWGTTHYGIDIANSIGTPILAAADGVVVEAGSASGFGLWVRIQHEDGTITVYGHVNEYLVEEGQEVRAGDEIAEMGNRGYSTGPHLHFEVWLAGGEKTDPLSWLNEHGVAI